MKSRDENIKKHMDMIISALNHEYDDPDNTLVIEEFINFGKFLRETFPGQKIENIQKSLKNFHDYENTPLPEDLKCHALLSGAAITISMTSDEQIAEQDEKVDALLKGVNLFGTLMGGDRIEDVESKLNITNKEIDDTVELVNSFEKRKLAENLRDECKQCNRSLMRIIKREALNRSDCVITKEVLHYNEIDKVANDVVNNKLTNPSSALVAAAESYKIAKELLNALEDESKSASEKLEAFNKEFNKDKTKKAIKSNPENIFIRLNNLMATLISKSSSILSSPIQRVSHRVKKEGLKPPHTEQKPKR